MKIDRGHLKPRKRGEKGEQSVEYRRFRGIKARNLEADITTSGQPGEIAA